MKDPRSDVSSAVDTSAHDPATIHESPLLLAIIVIALASIPPLLIVLHRWLGNRTVIQLFKKSWCSFQFLCSLALPAYFELVFACTLAVFYLVWSSAPSWMAAVARSQGAELSLPSPVSTSLVQSKAGLRLIIGSSIGIALVLARQILFETLPGWEFAGLLLLFLSGWVVSEVSVDSIVRVWRRHRRILVVCGVAHIALLATLAGLYGSHQGTVLSIGLLGLSAIWLFWYRRQVHPLFWIVSLALIVYTFRLDAWQFSAVGDEFSFYRYAREIVEKQDLAFIGDHLFWGTAVYGTHPYLSSFIQAISMKVFDTQNFGWRFSSLYVSAASLIFLYMFFRSFVCRRVALVATFFLAVSHYLMTFGKIGYNNTQALFAMGCVMAATAWAIRSSRSLAYVVLGGALGFCFYVYPAALYMAAVALFLLALYRPPTSKALFYRWAIMLLVALIFVSPLATQPEYWRSKVAGTFFSNSQLTGSSKTLLANIAVNLLYGFFSFLYIPQESHFVTVAYVDPITASLLLIGLATQVRAARENRFAFFHVVSLGVLFLLVGASHDRAYPTATRMFLLLPWFSLLAAFGLEWIRSQVQDLELPHVTTMRLFGVFLFVVLLVNLYQAYVVSIRRSTNYQSFEALFLRLAQNMAVSQKDVQPSLVLVNDPQLHHVPSLQEMFNIHYLAIPIREVLARATTSEEDRDKLLARGGVVVVSPRLPSDVRAEYEGFLGANQWLRCAMKTVTDEVRFHVWYPSNRPPPCSDSRSPTSRASSAVAPMLSVLLIGLVGVGCWRLARRRTNWRQSLTRLATEDVARVKMNLQLAVKVAGFEEKVYGAHTEARVKGQTEPFEVQPLERNAILGEWAVLAFVVLVFASKFLNFDSNQLLTGNEFEVFATLDFVIVNALHRFKEFPLWNSYLRTGQPLIADPFLHVFNPVSTIPILALGVVNGFKVGVFLSFVLAAIGQWLLSRELGLNRAVRLWSALLYALNGQAVARFLQGEYLFTLGYAWIPFVFTGVVISVRKRQKKHYALTSIALALLFFSGNVYYSYYMTIILGLFALVVALRFDKFTLSGLDWHRLKPLIVIGVLAFGLVAVQLIPTLEFWPHIAKAGDPELRTSQPLSEIMQDYLSKSTERPIARRTLPPEEFYGYIGLAPFLAALFALGAFWRGWRKEILALVALFMVVLVWAGARYTPLAWFYSRTSLLYQFRYPSRIIVFGACAIITLGGIGLTWLLDSVDRVGALRAEPPVRSVRWYIGWIFNLIVMLVMFFSVVDVLQTNRRLVGTRSLDQDASHLLAWLHEYDPEPHYVDVPFSTGWHMPIVSNEELHWNAWYGFTFFPPVRENRAIRQVSAGPNYVVIPKGRRVQQPDSTLIGEFGQHQVYFMRESLPYAFAVAEDALAQIDAGELRRSEVQPLDVDFLGPNALTVSADVADARAWIVVLSSFYPGWRVTIDGRNAELTNIGDYLAVRAVTGEHTYVFEYAPLTFKIGLMITSLSVIVVLGLLQSSGRIGDLGWSRVLDRMRSRLRVFS